MTVKMLGSQSFLGAKLLEETRRNTPLEGESVPIQRSDE
jgi:hypothetical protein